MKLSIILSIVFTAAGIVAPVASANSYGDQIVLKSGEVTNQLLEKLGIAKQQIFDTAGRVRSDVFNTWSEADLKAWAKAHGIQAPSFDSSDIQAFAAKYKDLLVDDITHYTNEAGKTASPYLTKAHGYLQDTKDNLFESAIATWSDSRLKEFLESRNVALSNLPTRDELLKAVAQSKDKAIDATKVGSWSFESWSTEDLNSWLKEQGANVASASKWTRDQLIAAADSSYKKGKELYDSGDEQARAQYDATSKNLAAARKASFDKWSESDLKAYLNSFGVQTQKVADKLELQRLAQTQYELFSSGTSDAGFLAKAKGFGYEAQSYGYLFFEHARHWHNLVYSTVLKWFGIARQKLEL